MNKSELIDQIAKAAGISKAAAGRALDATTAAVTKALKKGDLVTLIGFGTFYVGKRKLVTVVILVRAQQSRLKQLILLNLGLVKHLKML